MNIAVRYYSKTGNTKAVAEAIASAVNVDAVSVEKPEAQITEPVDVLFVGGALYAYGLDKHLKEYLKSLKKDNVKKAVVFSTSWLSKHSVELIKKGLSDNGITVEAEYFYVKNRPTVAQEKEAAAFAERFV
ncbi:MAG: flavodoxin [Clostridia bacterium]|nr:flavodoxin [Clostridia bacterium]